MLATDGSWRLTGRIARIARLGLLWLCGLVVVVYAPVLWLIALLGRCALKGEDSLFCTAPGSWTLMLLPVFVLPVTLVAGTRAALRDGGRSLGLWAVCLAVIAALGAAYGYLGKMW
ncbi:hypothetical protein [Streptomyces synnematoformans]|uniref:Integral membrane protein n=1 Tax=Streptomyces synnematoformans TaxID=415721 RepID=A0ABP5K9T3_9ACTN